MHTQRVAVALSTRVLKIVVALAAATAMGWSSSGWAQEKDRHEVNIQAQPIGAALKALADQTGLQVLVFSQDAGDKKSPAVRGRFTNDEALAIILRDSGLTYQRIDERTVAVKAAEPLAGAVSGGESVGRRGLMRVVQEGSAEEKGEGDAGKEAAGEKLEEIVVTAQKRKERLIDVPMSVTAKSGEELTARGIANIQDLSYIVPSLSVYSTSPAQQLISIRGVSSSRGYSPLTGVYLDEMPLSQPQDGSFPAYPDLRVIDLNRVEVLKGPQGTLYGEGAAGGLIRFITNDPDLSRVGGNLAAQLSNTSKGGWSESVTGVANLPLVTDVFGVRLAAKYENMAGWIDQPSVGRKDINDSDVKHVRVKALYAPTQKLRISGLVEINRDNYGATNITNQPQLGNDVFLQAYDPSWPTNGRDDYDMFNLLATYDLPFAQIMSSTSYAKTDSTQVISQVTYAQPGDPSPWLEILSRGFGHHVSIASQELRLTSPGAGQFHWTLGANYKRSELTFSFGEGGGGFRLFGGQVDIPVLLAGGESASRIENWAGFGDVSYQFTRHIEVGGGVRYSSYKNENWDPKALPVVVNSITSSKPTYRGFIKYAFSDDFNIYFNVGSGFRSGFRNITEQIALGAPAEVLPETTISYELGAKSALLDRRLRIAAAVFYTKYQDMFADRIGISPLNGITPIGYVANGQNARVKGAEAEIDWVATDRLSLMLATDVTDSKITEVDLSDPTRPYEVGDWVNFVPKYSVSTGANYRFNWSTSVPGSVRFDFNRKGPQRETQRGNSLIVVKEVGTPEVSFLNASVGAELSGWNWVLYGTNLLDEDRWVNASTFGLTAQARPRTFGITVSKKFD